MAHKIKTRRLQVELLETRETPSGVPVANPYLHPRPTITVTSTPAPGATLQIIDSTLARGRSGVWGIKAVSVKGKAGGDPVRLQGNLLGGTNAEQKDQQIDFIIGNQRVHGSPTNSSGHSEYVYSIPSGTRRGTYQYTAVFGKLKAYATITVR